MFRTSTFYFKIDAFIIDVVIINVMFMTSLMKYCVLFHRAASTHQKAVDEASETHRMVIDKLQEDRAMMEVVMN